MGTGIYWKSLRIARDKLLADTDKTQLADFPIVTEDRKRYKDYRQYLRDLPKMFNEETIKSAAVKTFAEYTEWKRNGTY